MNNTLLSERETQFRHPPFFTREAVRESEYTSGWALKPTQRRFFNQKNPPGFWVFFSGKLCTRSKSNKNFPEGTKRNPKTILQLENPARILVFFRRILGQNLNLLIFQRALKKTLQTLGGCFSAHRIQKSCLFFF